MSTQGATQPEKPRPLFPSFFLCVQNPPQGTTNWFFTSSLVYITPDQLSDKVGEQLSIIDRSVLTHSRSWAFSYTDTYVHINYSLAESKKKKKMLKITKENRLYSAATTRHTPNYIVYVSVYINTTITVQYRGKKRGK